MMAATLLIHTGLDGRYKYLEHLKSLEQGEGRHASSRTVDSRISSVNCFPLNVATWCKHLNHHPDRDFTDYILNGIQNGFRLGINPEATYTSVSRNMRSATIHQDVIDEYLKQEVELGNILGPFPKATLWGNTQKAPGGKMASDHRLVLP